MYISYVDDTGDPGLINSPTDYFGLTALTVHKSDWQDFQNQLQNFRKALKIHHGLPVRTEIHASKYVRSPPVFGMEKHTRLLILKQTLEEIAKINSVMITSVLVYKKNKPTDLDVYEFAWKALIQRIENTLFFGNFPREVKNEHGIIISDATNGYELGKLVRKMRIYNPVPSKMGGYSNKPISRIVEEPFTKDSKDSAAIQVCDVCAYFMLQSVDACSYVRKKGGKNWYRKLLPILNLRANPKDSNGIVRL